MSWLRRVARRLKPRPVRPVILMYHRVAEPEFDPWDLSVSPHHFAAQMAALAARRSVLSMDAYSDLAKRGSLPADAVAVTFDDGYADNLDVALPLLESAGVPATFFISTATIGQPNPYWWDELAGLVLGREPAVDTCVTVAGDRIVVALADRTPEEAVAIGRWRAANSPDGPRQHLYFSLWTRLQRLGAADRDEAMAGLRLAFEPRPAVAADLPMTREQIRRLAASPQATVGAHSVSHARLPDLTPNALARELDHSRTICSELAGATVRGFAYPYGSWGPRERQAVAVAGFSWACTTVGAVTPRRGADALTLPRLAAADVPAAVALGRLRIG